MVYPRLSRVDQKVVPVTLGYAGASLTAQVGHYPIVTFQHS